MRLFLRRIWFEITWRIEPRREYLIEVGSVQHNFVMLYLTKAEAETLRDAGASIAQVS